MTTKHLVAAVGAACAVTGPAQAGSHQWVINELFSNADGSVQFIEMKECCGSQEEWGLLGKWVRSEATGDQFTFPDILPCLDCTAYKHILLATEGFAALPGAPTPDHIIDPAFFDLVQDEITYWFYPKATLAFGPGDLPLDGIHSLSRDGSTAPNTPTNFDDQSGSVVASCDPADLDASGDVAFADLLILLGSWGPCGLCPADLDSSGDVGFGDLLVLLAAWGGC